jgi:hypothetical protein
MSGATHTIGTYNLVLCCSAVLCLLTGQGCILMIRLLATACHPSTALHHRWRQVARQVTLSSMAWDRSTLPLLHYKLLPQQSGCHPAAIWHPTQVGQQRLRHMLQPMIGCTENDGCRQNIWLYRFDPVLLAWQVYVMLLYQMVRPAQHTLLVGVVQVLDYCTVCSPTHGLLSSIVLSLLLHIVLLFLHCSQCDQMSELSA